jgi:hypothetical protein
MQGSGKFFNFFTGDTFSVTVNPPDDATVPGSFQELPHESGYKKSGKYLISAIFHGYFHYARENTCY